MSTIKQISFGILLVLCLSAYQCAAGTGFSKPAATSSMTSDEMEHAAILEEITDIVAWLQAEASSLSSPLKVDVEMKDVKSWDGLYLDVRAHVLHRDLPVYYSADMRSELRYADFKVMLNQIKIHITESNDYVAKVFLMEFIEQLEDRELSCDLKILAFCKLFSNMYDFYIKKFEALELWDERRRYDKDALDLLPSATAIARYLTERAAIVNAFELTCKTIEALLHVLICETYRRTGNSEVSPLMSGLSFSAACGYRLLLRFVYPQLPSVGALSMGETGCSRDPVGTVGLVEA